MLAISITHCQITFEAGRKPIFKSEPRYHVILAGVSAFGRPGVGFRPRNAPRPRTLKRRHTRKVGDGEKSMRGAVETCYSHGR
jgi:hypothetical protein